MEVVRSLNYFVRRFECNRKNMRLNIQSGSSLAPNDLVRIQLPSNALIDLSTFQLTSDLTVTNDATGTGSLSACRITGTHNLVKRCNVVIGGVNVGSSDNHFGRVREAWKRASYAQAWNDSNVASNQALQRAASSAATTVASDDLKGSGHRSFDNWALSAMNINGSGILDTSIFGDCSVEIQFDSKYALNGPLDAQASAANIDWAGTNLKAYVDCLFLPNGDYASAIRDRLEGGGEVRAIVPNVVSSIQKNSSSNEFNISTQCLAGVMVAGLTPAYATEFNHRYAACQDDGTPSTPAQLGAKNYHLEIGSESYPAYGNVNDGRDGANMTRYMVGKSSPYNYNQLYHTHTATGNLAQDNNQDKNQTNYAAQNFIVGFDTSLEGLGCLHDSKLMSGVSTQGGNSVIRFISNDFDADQYWLFAGLCDSELIARRGQVVNFVA